MARKVVFKILCGEGNDLRIIDNGEAFITQYYEESDFCRGWEYGSRFPRNPEGYLAAKAKLLEMTQSTFDKTKQRLITKGCPVLWDIEHDV